LAWGPPLRWCLLSYPKGCVDGPSGGLVLGPPRGGLVTVVDGGLMGPEGFLGVPWCVGVVVSPLVKVRAPRGGEGVPGSP
jgi:hypothetical protein